MAVETGTPDVGDVPTPEITVVENTDSLAEPVTLALDADTAGEHYFYLSAQTTSTSQQLLIRPTKVYYDEGDSIAQALLQSGYSFADLDEQYSKFISKIQNVDGNFTYCGDFPEAVTLLEQASSIHYLYFSESTNAQMTSALQRLMQVAADYLDKPTDVQAAAKAVYDEVLAQYPGAVLRVAGWPPLDKGPLLRPVIDWMFPYQTWCKQLIRRLGLADHVQYTGPLDAAAMRQAYLDADLFLLPSYSENSPNSLGEAMLLGLPCVASAAGGIPDMLQSGVQGMLYGAAGDDAALSAAILQVLALPDHGTALGTAAQIRARVTHDAAKNTAQMIEIYRKVLQREGTL